MNILTQKIVKHSLEYAYDLLTDIGQCYPFGAFVDRNEVVHPLEFEIQDKKNIPNNETVVSGLRKYCKTEFKANRIIAYGIVYEASVQLKADAQHIDTIAMDIMDNTDGSNPIYYFPYKIESSGVVNFGETFAVKR